MEDIEKELAELFHRLPPKTAQEIGRNIPLLILFRLRKFYNRNLGISKAFADFAKVMQI